MSADNSIAVARFPKDDSYEWRVAHVQAIENCDDSNINNDGTIERWPEEFIDANRVIYYGGAKKFDDEKEAMQEAWRLIKEIEENEWFVEYGLVAKEYDRPLRDWTRPDAIRVIDRFWESEAIKYE